MPNDMMQESSDSQDMPMMDKLDQAVELLQSYIDDPSLVTPKTLQKLQDMLTKIKTGMASDMSSELKMPEMPSAQHMSGSEAAAANPYGGGNRKYTYAQYRPVK